jgi:uncharacterized membrane protein YgcG
MQPSLELPIAAPRGYPGLRIARFNPNFEIRNPKSPARPAFTLFELLLAIALSATLLVLIGTSINLYLHRVDASRTEVEEAQLARNILAMIAADIRATSVYQTQDISAIAALAASTSSVNVDDIDKAGDFKGSALRTLTALQSAGTLQKKNGQSGSSTGSSSSGSGGSSNGNSSSSSSSSDSSNSNSNGNQNPSDTVPGLNGSTSEIVLDVNRLPRAEELFPPGQQPTATSSSSSSTSAAARPTDAKTVHYFVRQGNAMDPSDIAVTSMSGTAQQQAGGLVRQTIDQAVRKMAEDGGSSDLLNTGQVLIAPEVVQIQFTYYDAAQGTAVDNWNMQEQNAMPAAVEVRIWLASSTADAKPISYATGSTPSDANMYSETIDLPLAAATAATSSSSSSNSTDDSNSNGSQGSSGSQSGGNNPAQKTPQTPSKPTTTGSPSPGNPAANPNILKKPQQ